MILCQEIVKQYWDETARIKFAAENDVSHVRVAVTANRESPNEENARRWLRRLTHSSRTDENGVVEDSRNDE